MLSHNPKQGNNIHGNCIYHQVYGVTNFVLEQLSANKIPEYDMIVILFTNTLSCLAYSKNILIPSEIREICESL
jgi:hypothetical protein